MKQKLKIILGPFMGLIVFFLMGGLKEEAAMALMAGVAVWIAIWWITEAVNIFFTSLMPLVLFPFLGIMSMKEVAPLYMNKIIFLFIKKGI